MDFMEALSIVMNSGSRYVTPETLLGDHLQTVMAMTADHSPFPRAQSDSFSKNAKLRAARIHLDETVFFGQVAYHDLRPRETVEVCAGFGLPSITVSKLHGVSGVCVDTDVEKMSVGAAICEKLDIGLTWERMDLFTYLRKHAQRFNGKVLLLTAAYCRDKKTARPMGSGERDLVKFARKHRIDLGLLPFRSGDILTKGISDERKRTEEYERILSEAGYIVKRHSTKALFQGQNAPDWFFLDVLTAKCNE